MLFKPLVIQAVCPSMRGTGVHPALVASGGACRHGINQRHQCVASAKQIAQRKRRVILSFWTSYWPWVTTTGLKYSTTTSTWNCVNL